MCDSASRALGSLNSKFKSLKIFHSWNTSILEYSTEIGVSDIDCVMCGAYSNAVMKAKFHANISHMPGFS